MDPALHQPPPADPGGLFSSASQLSPKQHRQRSVITTMWNINFLFYDYIIVILLYVILLFLMVFGRPESHKDYINNDDASTTTRNDWNVLFVWLFVFWDKEDWRFKDVFTLHSSLPMVEEKALLL